MAARLDVTVEFQGWPPVRQNSPMYAPSTRRRIRHLLLLAAIGVLLIQIDCARAQEIEPHAYLNAPVGVNFLVAGYAYATGSPTTDPSLPLKRPNLETSTVIARYARVLDLWDKSGKIDLILPYARLSGSALFDGAPVSRQITGMGDPAVRVSMNLYGAPALDLQQFASFRQDLIVGVSLQVSAPWGQYDSSRVVNIGTNRWSFKPELGISKAIGHWTLEASAAATWYTDNGDFVGGVTRSQDPLYAVQTHAMYGFRTGAWAAFGVTYYAGGRTTLDGSLNSDLQRNWRVGATLAIPFDRRNSLKFAASSGVWARTGNNFNTYVIAWQYRWGGGL